MTKISIQKIKTFIKSLILHIYSGFPKSSHEQILYRYNICSNSCDMYNSKDQTCMMCGCYINNRKIFLNKLAWADQECPLGKWKKIV